MYVAVDDTDSTEGNCTTFLMTEFIRELSDMDLIGNPRLVRLNPAVPWKTRGNGSLVMRIGKGTGNKKKIGEIDGKDVFCYENATSFEPDAERILERLKPIVDANHEDSADPGLVVSVKRPDEIFYWTGVRTIIERKTVDKEIANIGALTYEIGCGRGIIGSVCGMAWNPHDSTYELLTYRARGRWGTERIYNPETIAEVERTLPSTFNSYDEIDGKVAMVPSTPCPVMYGLRGDSEQDLMKGKDIIKCENLDRWVIFLTNQGTDDHLTFPGEDMAADRSYALYGTVISKPHRIEGGHAFFDLKTNCGTVACGAYEPSKRFRKIIDALLPGDIVTVLGELRDSPRTLNIEKIWVMYLVADCRKVSNPLCEGCGRTMESVGKEQGYRCRRCGTKSIAAVKSEVEREIVPGWYEPPVYARRHLSKPLKRGTGNWFPPSDNRRIQ